MPCDFRHVRHGCSHAREGLPWPMELQSLFMQWIQSTVTQKTNEWHGHKNGQFPESCNTKLRFAHHRFISTWNRSFVFGMFPRVQQLPARSVFVNNCLINGVNV